MTESYWEYPYDLVEYWSMTEKWNKRKQINKNDVYVIEKVVLEMTLCMKWMTKVLQQRNREMFEHDYYELVDCRKRILEVYKKFRPKGYKIFIKNNPKVLDYVEMEKEEKRPKSPKVSDN